MLTPLNITNKAGILRIRITGYIGEDITEKAVLDQIAALPGADSIEVYINSGGGNVAVGNAIAHVLSEQKVPKTAYIIGTCASMATLIALSCDRVVMDALAEWMVHLPIVTASGRSDQLKDAAIISEEMEQQFVELYSSRTGMDKEQMHQLLKEEKWLSAKRAWELGFVDEVLELQMAAFYPKNEASHPKRLSSLIAAATATDRGAWSYLDWAKKDPEGLASIKAHEPERFQALVGKINE